MNDLGNIHLDELIEGFDLMANELLTIRLQNKSLENVTVVGELIFSGRHGYILNPSHILSIFSDRVAALDNRRYQ